MRFILSTFLCFWMILICGCIQLDTDLLNVEVPYVSEKFSKDYNFYLEKITENNRSVFAVSGHLKLEMDIPCSQKIDMAVIAKIDGKFQKTPQYVINTNLGQILSAAPNESLLAEIAYRCTKPHLQCPWKKGTTLFATHCHYPSFFGGVMVSRYWNVTISIFTGTEVFFSGWSEIEHSDVTRNRARRPTVAQMGKRNKTGFGNPFK